jgi:hypothetical protein
MANIYHLRGENIRYRYPLHGENIPPSRRKYTPFTAKIYPLHGENTVYPLHSENIPPSRRRKYTPFEIYVNLNTKYWKTAVLQMLEVTLCDFPKIAAAPCTVYCKRRKGCNSTKCRKRVENYQQIYFLKYDSAASAFPPVILPESLNVCSSLLFHFQFVPNRSSNLLYLLSHYLSFTKHCT